MKRRAKSAFLVVLCSVTLTVARAEWRLEGETAGLYQSNLSNSDRSAEEEPAWAWRTDVRLGNGYQLTRDLRLNLAAELRSEVWTPYDAFTEIGSGISAGLRYRFGLGRLAPWVLLENRIGYDRFHETERSGWDEIVRLRGGFAISDRIAIEAEYAFQNFAVPDNFFDEQSHRVQTRLIFDLTSSLQVAVGYSYREGDVIAYAIPPRPEIAVFAIEREDVATFGSDPLRTAYRFQGRTNAVSFSAAYAVTKHFSLQIGYEYSSTSRDPVRYENHLVEARVGFAF